MSAPPVLVLARRIHTLDPDAPADAPLPDALLAQHGRVLAVGPAAELRSAARDAQILDLRPATLTPGLTDAHIHLVEWALARREVDLSSADSPEAAARMVGRHAGQGDGWVRGRGWNPHRWAAAPTRELLDRAVPGRPVALQSHDMHALWVSSEALRRAGIDRHTPDPDGGRIVRDADGEPTGLLLERAAELVVGCIPPATDAEVEAALLDAQAELHRLGITGVHCLPNIHIAGPDPLPTLETLRARGLLRLRVLTHLPLAALDDAIRLGVRSGFGGEWIRIGAVKMFLDGALGSRTAWLREPYVDSTDHGIQVLPADDFRDAVRRAAAAGIATAVHAIGDAAVSLALDVLADPAVRVPALPHRIEHVQLCPPERFADAGRHGITASVQPCHLITDWRPAERHWGHDRCRGAYAFRSLLAGGAVLAFGSDAPVEPVDPRLGLFAALARQDLDGQPADGWFPAERLAAPEALRGYTLGPAHAAGATGAQGVLAPGAYADFAAWEQDPLELAAPDILGLRCVATVVGGAVVWTRTSEHAHA